MTKDQATPIPEELYNLTQLAEVTLAAGRLSTTNIDKIKKYIYNSNQTSECHENESRDLIEGVRESELECNQEQEQAKERGPAKLEEQMPNEKKLILINQVTCAVTNDTSGTWNYNENNNDSVNNTPAPKTQDSTDAQAREIITTTTATSTLYTSSDDDSNYYSHKVFDRKKLRRSTISDSNSRYDEHSCSSISGTPSCSSGNSSNSSSCDEHISSNASLTGSDGLGLLDDEHICPECGKKYSTSSNLARHRQTHRSIMDKKARRCPYCEKVYVSMPAYSMHVRTHNQGCKCDYCGKCFSRPWLLQGHIRTHTGEKPFKCSICSKAFADKSNLRAHIQTHSNTKPHTCTRCGKAFALKSYLYKHEESSCMKNRNADRDIRSTRIHMHSSSVALGKLQNQVHQISKLSSDSAKSTLANKLLQKEKDRLQTTMTYAALPLNITTISDLSATTAPAELPKSYTMLTTTSTTAITAASQDDYERYKRISVLQPTALPHPNAIYQDQMAMPFYSHQHHSQLIASGTNTPQEQPVDFSPKNNFTHSSKTSPFELTGSYAMVA